MLDSRAKPPDVLRAIYKKYQAMTAAELTADANIIDFHRGLTPPQQACFHHTPYSTPQAIQTVFAAFHGLADPDTLPAVVQPIAYHHVDLPDLMVLPNMLPVSLQRALLSRLLHRDLSNPAHATNMHAHHTLASTCTPTSTSLFTHDPARILATPKDAAQHKPLTAAQLLTRKLRWITLGAQYDWTRKAYPPEHLAPAFPRDVGALVEGLFPATRAQAAIVNLYSPGDTLSLHRDVSEACGVGLVSVSVGCDAVFVVGDEGDGKKIPAAVLRLRSGDVVYMAGAARFAWHGVPLVVRGTCPEELRSWPGGGDGGVQGYEEGREEEYAQWQDWMAGKRINLNVRQMV